VKHATGAPTRTGPPRDNQNGQLWAAKDAANLRSKAAHIGGYFEVVTNGSVTFRCAPPAAAR